jgi:nucleotide-binding universal stress UspA family protein
MELVRNLVWPSGTTIRVLAVCHAFPFYGATPGAILTPQVVERTEAAFWGEAEALLCSTVGRLGRPEIEVQGEVSRSAATGAIIDEAERLVADLIVVGSRGMGWFESSFVGSTSVALVDHAPCSVLVARGDTIHRILFADDGSELAGRAGEAVRTWPILRRCPVRVISVSDVPRGWQQVLLPFAADVQDAYEAAVHRSHKEHMDLAAASVNRLHEAGIEADSAVPQGNPAHHIVEAAVNWGADLVVLGHRGRTGRLSVGSVAHNVLLHAPCSVLVVRAASQPAEARSRR